MSISFIHFVNIPCLYIYICLHFVTQIILSFFNLKKYIKSVEILFFL